MAQKEGNILIVDDNQDLLIALRIILSRHFDKIQTLNNPNLILSTIEKEACDVILLDMNFKAGITNGNEGIFWLKKILEYDKSSSVLMITAFGDIELAVTAMKEGAYDFILKSWDEHKILSSVKAAYRLRKSGMEVSLLKKKQQHLNQELIRDFSVCNCRSDAMQDLNKMVAKIAGTDASVLVLGENGTGKEVIAREIHRQSERRNEIFVKVDLGALPEPLFESELFGHTKGAFTDAKEERDGRFVIASGGTIFLDEIGNIPLSLQSKLLSAIQNREIYPLGSSLPIKTDVRIISATNMPLSEMIGKQLFREDLFYRINAIQIEMPSLRERKEDIEELSVFFLKKYGLQYGKEAMKISSSAFRRLREHDWPGNVRELEHTIEKGVILAEFDEILPEHLFPACPGKAVSRNPETLDLEENEKHLVRKALQLYKGNVSNAAKKLGINRSTLYQKMKKYGI